MLVRLTEPAGGALLVNLDNVIALRPGPTGTQVLFAVSGPKDMPVTLIVKEGADDIMAQVSDAGAKTL